MGKEAAPSIQHLPWPQRPTVSVIIACYDDGATLPLALASLLCQTFPDWEALIIDDGSSPSVAPIVASFQDRRLHYHAFSENRGRPVARQKGLELARGDYICMLDADDWYYPHKLQWQLEVLDANPQLLAVSTAMAVVDMASHLKGIRSKDHRLLSVHHCKAPTPPKMAFSPVMIRREVATQHSFDPRLQRAEDPDYLMKVLDDGLYAVLNRPAYVYREQYSAEAMREAFKAFRYQRLIYRRYLMKSPAQAARQYMRSILRSGIYRAAWALGQGPWLFERRNRGATNLETRQFYRARTTVERALFQPRFAYGRPLEFSQ